MRVQAAGKSDKGYVRSNNEDAFLIDDDHGIYAVADGMGGHKAGEIASRVTLDAIQEMIGREGRKFNPDKALERGLQSAGLRIFAQIEQDASLRGMGTTLTAMMIPPKARNAKATLIHVGDSRCYLWRKGVLTQLTEDHSWVWEQRKAGLLSDTEAATHPMRNVITRSVGHGGESNPDVIEVDLTEGDVLMLCSDGLCGYVPDSEVADVIRQFHTDPSLLVERLVSLALNHGGEDNVTIVAVRIA